MKEFMHQWNFKSNDIEKGGGENLVEVKPTVPEYKRIEQMILAGARLDQIRDQQYDSDVVGDLEEYWDPTRTRGFDMVDAQLVLLEQQKRLRAFNKQKAEAYKASAAGGSGGEQPPQKDSVSPNPKD